MKTKISMSKNELIRDNTDMLELLHQLRKENNSLLAKNMELIAEKQKRKILMIEQAHKEAGNNIDGEYW